MCRVTAVLARFWQDQRGATAIEYALVAMVIALALVTMFSALGSNIESMWNSVATNVIAAGQ